ncbi:hypothetical protein WICPIJ_007549 [Wickerhamomyces pijperi]|uniref:Uncharacterized protein n=1 Tax=Wickerhamomyces pijperi TaxID=599730 RepID=A0A9P8TJZ2_WICPI|nr:hypothetical protein WICPIJ_007549 [Wickerhamomyces pijperi]
MIKDHRVVDILIKDTSFVRFCNCLDQRSNNTLFEDLICSSGSACVERYRTSTESETKIKEIRCSEIKTVPMTCVKLSLNITSESPNRKLTVFSHFSPSMEISNESNSDNCGNLGKFKASAASTPNLCDNKETKYLCIS